MFIDWKTSNVKMSTFPKMIDRFYALPIKLQMRKILNVY